MSENTAHKASAMKSRLLLPASLAGTSRRNLVLLIVLLLVLYAVVPRLSYFSSSLHAIRQANISDLLKAAAAMLVTYAVAAAVYRTLAYPRLRYGRTILTQFAATFANRLLPSGIGAISVNFIYLRKNGQSAPEAAATVAINNVLGLVGHSILLIFAVAFLSAPMSAFSFKNIHVGIESWWIVIAVLLAAIALAKYEPLRQRAVNGLRHLLKSIGNYRRFKGRLTLALMFSICVTLSYVVCLTACAWAVGADLSFSQILVVLSLGVAGGVVAPTPGGLIGAEAGLVLGMVAYGASSGVALAAVLIYRLFTYWLPLVLGGLAFSYARRRRYI